MRPIKNMTVETLFDGRPDALRLFQTIRRYIESLGPVNLKVTKTQVSFTTRRGFAWVWLPQMWVKTRQENSIVVSFSLDHRLADVRIADVVEPYPGRFMHHLVIEDDSDLSEDIREWLREAYLFGGGVREA